MFRILGGGNFRQYLLKIGMDGTNGWMEIMDESSLGWDERYG